MLLGPSRRSPGRVGPRGTREFGLCILRAGLEDLRFAGRRYSGLTTISGPDSIATKIDQVLVNEEWLRWFPLSSAFFLPSGTSDHSPGLVTMGDREARPQRPFRRSKLSKVEFKRLNEARFSDISRRVREHRVILDDLQRRVDSEPCERIRDARRERRVVVF
ncbi:hypothetical protein Dimus_037569 [Dionaea muscipula]